MADDLCKSYMINTRIYHSKKVYSHSKAVVELVRELGARNVRERVILGSSDGARKQRAAMLDLAGDGVRWHATVGLLSDWRHALAANRRVMEHLATSFKPHVGDLSHLFRSLGGCNEVDGPQADGRRDPDWARHALRMQRALWRAANERAATRDLPIVGPSTRTDFTAARARELGDLSAYADQGCVHYYNKGISPTRGIDARVDISRQNYRDARIWVATETGYNDSPQTNTGRTIPEDAAAIYAVRGICDFFKRGIVYGRFELLDDPDEIDRSSQATINATADREAHFGLIGMTQTRLADAAPRTWRKKPEFFATKHLLSVLSDRGSAFTTEPLHMAIRGGDASVQQLVLQKRDGKHYLVLWRDVNIVEPYPSGRRLFVSPLSLEVVLATARPVAVYQPNTSDVPVYVRPARTSHPITLAGELVVIEIG